MKCLCMSTCSCGCHFYVALFGYKGSSESKWTHTNNIASRLRAWYELKEKCLHNTYSCKDMRSKEEEEYSIYRHTFSPRRGDCSLASGMRSHRLWGDSSGSSFCFTICALNTCIRNWPTSCHLSKCPTSFGPTTNYFISSPLSVYAVT